MHFTDDHLKRNEILCFSFSHFCPAISVKYLHHNIVITLKRKLTFPHGESHAGSPGLLAFHSAKSRSDFFSPLEA